MIEELTPQILMVTMLLVIVVAPSISLPLAAMLLHRYRAAVSRVMARSVGFIGAAPAKPAPVPGPQPPGADAETLRRRAFGGPLRNALRYLSAALVFAAVFSTAAQYVYPSQIGTPAFFIGVWIYLWPYLLALPWLLPLGAWPWLAAVTAYFAAYALLGLWAGTVHDIPGYRIGALALPSRSSVTPVTMGRLWLVVNAAPTVLALLSLNRWVRAVAPLVLALVTAIVAGLLATYLALFSPHGIDLAVAAATALDLHIYWLLGLVSAAALLLFAGAAWLWLQRIAASYRRGRLSDQSLQLDAIWLLFASNYAMWLVYGGAGWVAIAPLAFIAYRVTWRIAGRLTSGPMERPVGVTLLRVFALGRRSVELLAPVSHHWRHLGPIQLITGPDLATHTVQPHQFLDFLARRLERHFVGDDESLRRGLAERDRAADPDGRFRINNFFCHADSWKSLLPRLVEDGDLVLMDLRSFAPGNDGCVHELHHLIDRVPLHRCLLVVDATTDTAFLDATLDAAWRDLPADSPNRLQQSPGGPERLCLEPGTHAFRALVVRLCEKAAAAE